jgi:hypothetical protein
MIALESIASSIESLPPAQGDAWSVHTVVPNRLHLTRGPRGEYALFLEGASSSFGTLPPHEGIAYSSSVTALPTGRTLEALRLQSVDDQSGNRVIAHIAYELARRLEANPAESGEELLRSVEWILSLLGSSQGILLPERRLGLIGECLLLRRLLRLARTEGIGPETVLDRWWGYSAARRDFAARGLGVEVKTTSHNTRTHRVGLDQLEPVEDGEFVYLYSIGLKSDPTAPKKLPDFVLDVEAEILDPTSSLPHPTALGRFREDLQKYGYNPLMSDAYRAGHGYLAPHLSAQLFAEGALSRLRRSSFVGGAPPSNVSGITFDLTVESNPVSDPESVLLKLLKNPPASYS